MSNNYIDPWGTNTGGGNRQATTHAYWVHEKIKVKESVTGYYYLPDCSCSKCGQYVRRELPVCPKCNSIMDAKPQKK